MNEVAAAAALVLAAMFAWAAIAKIRGRRATIDSFRGLGLPAPVPLSIIVPVVELAVAVGLVVAPVPASFLALVLLGAFSVVIGRAVAAGSTAGCACFGGGPAQRPVSVVELVRNASLGGLAIVATGAGAASTLRPSLPALLAVLAAVVLGWVALAAAGRRRA